MKPLTWLILLSATLAAGGCGGQGPAASTQLDVPAAVEGTTVDARQPEGDPLCGPSGPTVWYRLGRDEKARIAVGFRAGGDLEASVCALQDSPSGLASVKQGITDERGNVNFDFEADAGTTYYLAVTQDPESEPGAFTLDVKALARPGNDDRASATQISSLPSTLTGTTVGATLEEQDPGCVTGEPSVWYRVASTQGGRLVASLEAERGIETAVCAMQKVRSHLRVVGADSTEGRGNASLAFKTDPGATYFVAVSRPTRKSGRFSLTLQRPDDPPVLPGESLKTGTGRGHLHPFANPEDAWAVKMNKGTTYRLTLVTEPEQCVSMTVYSLRARSFKSGPVAAEFECAETEFFAPGPDGGGVYPVLLATQDEETTYQLYVTPVQPDDSGPGVALESGARVVGWVSAADPLDLYRFDVSGTSSVEVRLASRRYVDVVLKNEYGRAIRTPEPNATTTYVLDTGTYYLAVTPSDDASRYTLGLMVRFVTTTSLTVDGTSSVTIRPGESVFLQTTTVPYPGPGETEVQADFFDVATGKWVFRQVWEVAPGSAITFTPDAVGRWRVRATFFANDVASMSRTRYCSITVSTV
jgi:hypothetical protein